METTNSRLDQDRPIALHRLVFLADGDETTIGRAEIDSYAIFPPDGAEVVRRLEAGATPSEVARWYEREYGETADIDHVVAALGELGFLRDGTGISAAAMPVRWQRLGVALFSPPAWVIYAALVSWAGVAMYRSPDLVPSYRSIFFTDYYAVIELTLLVGVLPLLIAHECFHVLAGRRLGVRSRLGINRRLYFVVLETRMDGLVAVPRRKRYLPILAGILFDVVALAALVVAADLTRGPGDDLSFPGRLCLAFAFTTVIRIVWQFYFYLRTDLYVLLTTVLGCVDLHATTRRLLADRVNRLLGRRDRLADRSSWHPVDRRAARWYAWLVVGGYAFSIGTLLLALLPILARVADGLLGRVIGDSPAAVAHLADSVVFLALTLGQVAVSGWLALRDRRARDRSRFHHVVT